MAQTNQQQGVGDAPPYVDAHQLKSRMGYREAAGALRDALQGRVDPSADLHRSSEHLTNGSLLLMPSDDGAHAGLKVLTMAPDNPAHDRDLIQGLYLLFDGETLTPTHLLDGVALTELRTAAMTMVALAPACERFSGPLNVVIFGAGHQGRAHASAVREVLGQHHDIAAITGIVRQPERIGELEPFDRLVAAGSDQAHAALCDANIVVCATPATEPLFDSAVLRHDVVVAAVGSHTPQARELDSALMGRANVIVEDIATALRECGDVIQARDAGAISVEQLIPVQDIVIGARDVDPSLPYVFKGSGMPWQDLAVAAAAVR